MAQARALDALLTARNQPLSQTIHARLLKAIDSRRAKDVDAILSNLALLEIHINPESRVKVTRGRGSAELRQGAENLLLARVTNESGVTGPLRCFVPIREPGPASGRAGHPPTWLAARVISLNGPSIQQRLSGGPVEYAVLSLSTQHVGLREATLAFDVGQGTQDLGFRGELPVLFRCLRALSK